MGITELLPALRDTEGAGRVGVRAEAAGIHREITREREDDESAADSDWPAARKIVALCKAGLHLPEEDHTAKRDGAMHILVINSGSSSIKFTVFESGGEEPKALVDGELAGIGGDGAELTMAERDPVKVDAHTPELAIQAVVRALDEAKVPQADAVGYRVVHPGAKLKGHQRITDEVLRDLDKAAEFAPLHDPAAVKMIRVMQKLEPEVPRFACFDTVFHETMPVEATTYALPRRFRDAGVRRYGFHGLSCESIVRRMRLATGGFPERAVIAHLGSGCSVTALRGGTSVDTTMGLTPTGGVVMGTRPGDLDPGVVLYLLRKETGGVDAVEKMLNHEAGMVAISGRKNDVKAVREAAAKGDEQALLALKVFTRSVRKAIGAYAWLLGGLDALIFAGGIGEHDATTRSEVLDGLEQLGFALDASANGARAKGARRVDDGKHVPVWVAPAEEDLMIALHVERMMDADRKLGEPQRPRRG
jgi:acetate kinase